MGNDGGSIPTRRELVKRKKRAPSDRTPRTNECWRLCALSRKPLAPPIVGCRAGKLYNKEAVLEHLLDRGAFGDADKICPHVLGLKDVKCLVLTDKKQDGGEPEIKANEDGRDGTVSGLFVCPVTLKEMNGTVRFGYLHTCGCVLSMEAIQNLGSGKCLLCDTVYEKDDIVELNPSKEKAAAIITNLLDARKGRRRKRNRSAQSLEDSNENKEEGASGKRIQAHKKRKTVELGEYKETVATMVLGTGASVETILQQYKPKEISEKLRAGVYTDKAADRGPQSLHKLYAGTFNRYIS